LLPVLTKLFQGLMLAKLLAAHKAGQLKFFGQHAHLAERKAFAAYLAPLRRIKWYIYLKPPFGGPAAVLAYLSRSTHRVAIANSRLIACDHDGVTFRYKDYRADGRARYKRITLATDEFIRRFLIHVLPSGFHRIRHYGLFARPSCADNIAHARELLAVPRPQDDNVAADADNPSAQPPPLASLSMLRRMHDHHRDLRTRLNAASSANRSNHRHQDRHIMTTTTVPQRPSDNLIQRWLRSRGDVARTETLPYHRTQPATATLNDYLDQQAELLLSAGRPTNPIGGPCAPLSHPVHCLQVELIGGLGGDELHRWPLHRLGDRLGIAESFFCSFE
jgi:hypothetical protein